MIVDEPNHVIRKRHDGRLNIIVGTGLAGYTGDGKSSKQAASNDPEGIWVSADGTIIIGYGDNRVIRQIDPNGIVSTVAGVYSPRIL